MRITRRMLRAFMHRCLGRHNSYALQQSNGRYRRVAQPITDEVVFAHVQGVHTLGTYLITEDGMCRFAVFDSDHSTGLADLALVQSWLLADGIPSSLELSRRGAHLWVFFASPLPAPTVRAWLLPYCPANVEFYPKQDQASDDRPGSLIRVPLGVHQRSGERYPFVQVDGEQVCSVVSSVVDALHWFEQVECAHFPDPLAFSWLAIDAQTDQRLAIEAQTDQTPMHPHTIPFSRPVGLQTVPIASSIRDWCRSYDPLAVIGRYVSLNDQGMGCCPFGNHHSDGIDHHPSFWVYQPTGNDLCCWFCHVWQQGGSLFDFFRYYYGLSAAALWSQIRSGAWNCC